MFMEKIKINEHLIQYRITEKLDRVTYYTSAYLFHQNGEGVLIDAGYYEMGKLIKEDLRKLEIELKYIIISHYHKDHAQGAIPFDIPIIGSDKFETNYEKCQSVSKYNYRKPDILVKEKMNIKLHDISLEIGRAHV